MPCFHPLQAWRGPGGSIVFNRKDGWSDRPLDLACGQCAGCRIVRSREWAVRCCHEAQSQEPKGSCFLTLTYDDEHLPADQSLNVRDWQLFAKRLRKLVGPFRFFHCGEYGDENLRPHYHALLFGVSFVRDRYFFRMSNGHRLYRSPTLEKAWKLGFSSIGSMSFQSAAYVSRYCLKKVTGDNAEAHYMRPNLETGVLGLVKPEYITMSRRPGIGSDWFEKFSGDVFPSDDVVLEGKHFKTPRFYDCKLDSAALADVKAVRRRGFEKRCEDVSSDRLVVREKCLEDRLKFFKRIM